MNFEEFLTFNNVLQVADIRKNFMYGSLLSKHGFKIFFDELQICTHNERDVRGKSYMCDSLFKMNVVVIAIKDENYNKIVFFFYCFEFITYGMIGYDMRIIILYKDW